MITEIVKLPDSEAAAIEREAGFLVRVICPGAMNFEKAREIAEGMICKGMRVGIYKLVAVVEEGTPPEPLPSAGLIAAGDRIRKCGPVGIASSSLISKEK